MSSKLKALSLAVLSLAFAGSASAAVFDYSYTYNSGAKISGSLTGVLQGDYVVGVSNISVLANGVSLSDNTFYLGGILPEDSGFSSFGGRLSPIQSLNRFVFLDSPDINEFAFTAFFDFDGNLSTGNFGSNSHYGQTLAGQSFRSVLAADRPVNSSFVLLERDSSNNGEVPEPATLLLFGAAIGGMALSKRPARKG